MYRMFIISMKNPLISWDKGAIAFWELSQLAYDQRWQKFIKGIYMYNYGWFMLYGRNQHNLVKQLSSI